MYSENIDAPLDGNKCCDVNSIKRCIHFWSRPCIGNARVEHSKSTPIHPKKGEE